MYSTLSRLWAFLPPSCFRDVLRLGRDILSLFSEVATTLSHPLSPVYILPCHTSSIKHHRQHTPNIQYKDFKHKYLYNTTQHLRAQQKIPKSSLIWTFFNTSQQSPPQSRTFQPQHIQPNQRHNKLAPHSHPLPAITTAAYFQRHTLQHGNGSIWVANHPQKRTTAYPAFRPYIGNSCPNSSYLFTHTHKLILYRFQPCLACFPVHLSHSGAGIHPAIERGTVYPHPLASIQHRLTTGHHITDTTGFLHHVSHAHIIPRQKEEYNRHLHCIVAQIRAYLKILRLPGSQIRGDKIQVRPRVGYENLRNLSRTCQV